MLHPWRIWELIDCFWFFRFVGPIKNLPDECPEDMQNVWVVCPDDSKWLGGAYKLRQMPVIYILLPPKFGNGLADHKFRARIIMGQAQF